jgi:hypothetical protein
MLSATDQAKIADYLRNRHIPRGRGSREESCSIVAINLALTGKLTDDIPECMSKVIGRWIIVVQDEMPDSMRNNIEWRRLLPITAGTGRDFEQESARCDIIMNWMWEAVLPIMAPIAEKYGSGDAWQIMCEKRTSEATMTVRERIAWSKPARAASWAGIAARAAERAAWAGAASAAARTVEGVEGATKSKKKIAWEKFNPCGLLQQLCEGVAI